MKTKLWTGLSLALIVAMMVTSFVLADNVQNDVAANPGNDTFTVGSSTTVNYRIHATNGDGNNGCNAADGSAASVTINVPSGVTATPNPVSFTACETDKSVVFSSNTEGDYEITVSVSDSGAGTYNTNPAKFTLHVDAAPPPSDTTPPVLSLPANITAEATGPSGAVVNYTASANDAVDGPVAVSCSPTSGSTFALGTTTVNCSATDAAGNTANDSFSVSVVDTTAPTLTLPSNTSAEATGPSGATVTYSASASDLVDGSVAVSCSPASGATFALGTTTVNCSATDAAGNTASGSFSVSVVDTTPPTLSLPSNITAEATGPSGATVTYSASASDLVSGSVAVSCSPASGSTFALGTTTVNCSATDAASNTASGSFSVTVQDTTAPALTVPANITVPATSPTGAVVTFSATAIDLVDPAPVVTCVPASGSTFAPGTTTVSCTAQDASGNTSAPKTFTIKVTYQLFGFYQPVDMNMVNVAKNGSTVPLKFEVFAGSTELTSTSIVSTFVQALTCGTGVATDDIENYATGGTSLRYDTTGGQFIFNWQTPKKPGNCYRVTLTTSDGSSIYADFRLK